MTAARLISLYHSSFRLRLFLVLSPLSAAIAIVLTTMLIIAERDTSKRQLIR